MKKLQIAAIAASALAIASVALAQFEAHPHLRAAHNHIDEAVAELRAANDGRWQFGGHRDRAEEMLRHAQEEIRAAAEYANHHPHH